MNDFGNEVKKHIAEKSITQSDIAQKINLKTNTVNSLLNRDNISLGKMKQIAEALDCDLEIKLIPKEDKDGE